jgi:ABC-type lipoprotein export system ATPase subunit/cell division protein FtsL
MINIIVGGYMIELKNVTKIYKSKKTSSTTALNNINLKIQNKGLVFITGKSGSGKSTLLNILGGLDSPTTGDILINNKNITKFKKKQYDSYRNTYIGFIFQEFNILEEYTVYENIELALKLQNQKVSKKKIDSLLEQLGINELGKRKPNELSGGQKQRVAIARALIKNPKIILADEPTGNLDTASSEQIFNILKEISKEKLVIVVSHDTTSALKYADRIIEIEDGNVISKEVDIIEETEPLNLKKSHLPLSYALKMAITSFKTKPFKLFMTILLTAISLIFMGFTVNCALFDKTMLVTRTMKNNNNYIYDIYKTEFGYQGSTNNLTMDNDDFEELKKITNSKLNISYTLYDNGNELNFEFGENDQTDKYYSFDLSSFNFIEIKDERLIKNLIGEIPKNNNEIAVHKYFADYAINFGIMTSDNTLYFPKDYNDLVTSKQKIKLGNNEVIITGIIDDDDSLYQTAKLNKNFDSDKLYNYFYNHFVYDAHTIYVNGFTDNVNLRIDKYSLLDKTAIHGGKSNEETFVSENMKALESSVEVITEKGIVTMSNLSKENIIISVDTIKKFDTEFDSKFNNYLALQKNKTYNDSLKDFLKQYLKENTLNIKLTIYLDDVVENDAINKSVKIVGVSLDNNNYISSKYIEDYNPIVKKVYSIRIYDDNMTNLSNSLKNLKFRDAFNPQEEKAGTYYNYIPNIGNSSDLSNIIGTYKALTIYILIISLVFVLFTFLLFSNFIALSISYCKKEIGILRAIGATSKDVIKIFGYESIIIAIISWLVSMIGWFKICDILNNSMFGKNYYTLNGIITNPLVPLIMLAFTITIAIVITVTSINRTTKIKPIDAILNK